MGLEMDVVGLIHRGASTSSSHIHFIDSCILDFHSCASFIHSCTLITQFHKNPMDISQGTTNERERKNWRLAMRSQTAARILAGDITCGAANGGEQTDLLAYRNGDSGGF